MKFNECFRACFVQLDRSRTQHHSFRLRWRHMPQLTHVILISEQTSKVPQRGYWESKRWVCSLRHKKIVHQDWYCLCHSIWDQQGGGFSSGLKCTKQQVIKLGWIVWSTLKFMNSAKTEFTDHSGEQHINAALYWANLTSLPTCTAIGCFRSGHLWSHSTSKFRPELLSGGFV